MIWFSRSRSPSVRSLLTIALLLLIIQLLILDPPDRRPFVQNLVLKSVAAVESACAKVKEAVFADTTTRTTNTGRELGVPDPGPVLSPEPPYEARPPDLPADFLSELQQAVEQTGDRAHRANWIELCTARDHASRVETAVRLARALPPEWWPVDGELVHELDLPPVLRNRRNK
jgi:hypothetical protein